MSGAWTDDIPPYLVVGIPGGARIEIGPGDVIKIFNSSNFLVAELSEAGLQVFGTDGSQVAAFAGAVSEITIEPAGGNVNPAIIAGGVAGSGAPQLIIESPQQTATSPNTRASMILQGANATFGGSFANLGADSIQIIGLAGTTGVGSAVLDMGNAAGSPAGINLGISGGSAVAMDGGGLSLANNVTISTGTIDLLATTISLNLVRARMQVWGETYPLTAGLTLTGVSQPIVFGASSPSGNVPSGTGVISVSTQSANARWEITLWTDVQINTAGDTSVADLLVDGSLVPGEAIFATAGATGRATVSQGWQGQFAAAGTHTFQATGKRAAGAGVADVFNGVHTKIRVNVYE